MTSRPDATPHEPAPMRVGPELRGLLAKSQMLPALLKQAENDPPLAWLIPPFLPDAGNVFVVAATNVGKTWLALFIAKVAAIAGRTVWLIEEEGSRAALADRIRKIALPSDVAHRVRAFHQQGLKLDEQTITAIVEWIATEVAPVLIVDCLGAVFVGDENSTNEANVVIERLRRLQRANPRLLLVVVHHASKAGAQGSGTSTARGSSAFSAFFDTQLNLRPCKDVRGRLSLYVDVTKQREAELAERQKVTITFGKGVSVTTVGDVIRNERGGAILDVLAKGPASGLSRNEIYEATGGKRLAVLKEIARLLTTGECELGDRKRIRLAGSAS